MRTRWLCLQAGLGRLPHGEFLWCVAGRPSPCVTLADCAHLMIDHFDDVVENLGLCFAAAHNVIELLSDPRNPGSYVWT